jgi:hypothetical protein
MRLIVTTCLAFLTACAGQPSLEELTKEALRTGDWTRVERRENAMSRVGSAVAARCPDGTTYFCEELGAARSCECVPSSALAGKVLGP